ncbi:MAG: 2-dehydropantoate 2-reductase [Deltaproteobacteria bacterium]
MDKKIAVLGTGAIGSSVGADFTRAGYDVVLIDQWAAHVEAMKSKGLRIKMAEEELHVPVRAFHLYELCVTQPRFDIVFLAAKSYDTLWMVQFIKPYLKEDGVLVSLQNSINDEWIPPIIGYQRDIGSVLELSAEVFEPGQVKRNSNHKKTWFALGELHGRMTPRLKQIAEILGNAGRVDMTTNIWGAKMSKLVVNTMISGVCGIFGLRDWELIQRPELVEVSIRLGRESLRVGTNLGYNMEPIFGMSAQDLLGSTDDVLKKSLLTLVSYIGKEARSMIYQDLLKKRQTEIDYINGLVVRKGREADVPTPFNATVASVIKQIELGELEPDVSNLAKFPTK